MRYLLGRAASERAVVPPETQTAREMGQACATCGTEPGKAQDW